MKKICSWYYGRNGDIIRVYNDVHVLRVPESLTVCSKLFNCASKILHTTNSLFKFMEHGYTISTNKHC